MWGNNPHLADTALNYENNVQGTQELINALLRNLACYENGAV